MDIGLLTLTFSETVRASSVQPEAFTLQESTDSQSLNFTITNGCLDSNCAACAGPINSCISCNAGLYLHNLKKETNARVCIESCPDGFYHGPDTAISAATGGAYARQCLACHPTCPTCSGPNVEDCSTCFEAEQMRSEQQIPTPQVQSLGADTTCASVCDYIPSTFRGPGLVDASISVTITRVFWQNYTADEEQFILVIEKGLGDVLNAQVHAPTGTGTDASVIALTISSQKIGLLNSVTFNTTLSADQYFYETLSAHLRSVVSSGTLLVGLKAVTEGTANLYLQTTDGDVSYESQGTGMGSMCNSCDSSCVSCTGNGTADCTECASSSFLLNRECVEECPIGMYVSPDGQFCMDCGSNCNRCTAFDECLECEVAFDQVIYLEDGLCLHEYHKTIVVSQLDSTVVTFNLSTPDINTMKQSPFLTEDSDTFMRVTSAGASDIATNDLVPIGHAEAQSVKTYTRDSTRPLLEKFDYNINTNVLTLHFSETMRSITTDPTRIIFQGSKTVGDYTFNNSHQLTGGAFSTADSKIITINITFDDTNAIKRGEENARDEASTFLVFDGSLVEDMAGNQVVNRTDGDAILVALYSNDTINPTLISYSLDMNTDTLVFTFSETVDASSFDPRQVRLQDNATSPEARCTCIECEAEFYAKDNCTDTVETLCQGCTLCAVGEWAMDVCAKYTDTNCQPCPVRPEGKYVQSLCYDTFDTQFGDCTADCKSCSDSGANCLECGNGKVLYDGECVDACPGGTYSDSGVCYVCDQSCETCSAAGVDGCDSCPWGLALSDGKCTFACYELDPSNYRDTAADRFVNVTTTLGFANTFGQSVQQLLVNNKFQDVVSNVLAAALEQAVGTIDRVDTGSSDTTPFDVSALKVDIDALNFDMDVTIQVDQAFYEDIETILNGITVSTEDDGEGDSKLLAELKVRLTPFSAGTQTITTAAERHLGNMCQACDGSCLKCTGSTSNECSVCAPGTVLDGRSGFPRPNSASGACVSECPSGTYFDDDAAACVDCHNSCSTCSSGTVCSSCAGSLVLEGDFCRANITAYPPAPLPVQPDTTLYTSRPLNCTVDYGNMFGFTGALDISTVDATTVTMVMTVEDSDSMKMLDTVAKDKASTLISFRNYNVEVSRPPPSFNYVPTVVDMNSNPIDIVQYTDARTVNIFLEDTAGVILLEAVLDMNNQSLTLFFSEPVRLNTTVVPAFSVQNDGCLDCIQGTYRHGGRCLLQCPHGFYANEGVSGSIARSCKPCDGSCATCFGPSTNECSSCPATMTIESGACVSPCYSLPEARYRDNSADKYAVVNTTVAFDGVLLGQFQTAQRAEFETQVKNVVGELLLARLNSLLEMTQASELMCGISRSTHTLGVVVLSCWLTSHFE
jgi:hypothetical protein